jgi:uncharacterized membrane protein
VVRARAWYAVIVIVTVAALAIQLMIAVHAPGTPRGHGVGQLAGGLLATRIVRVFSFFTIQSNVLSVIVAAQLTGDPNRDGRAWRIVRLMALIGITVTGVVYSTVLARVHEPKGWEQVSTNTVFHYIVPTMMVLGFLLFGPRPRIDRTTLALTLIWPLLWMGYTLAHGTTSNWYPYPFVDVAIHGYGRVLVNAVLVAVVCVAVGALYALADHRLPATNSGKPSDRQPVGRPMSVRDRARR